MDLYILHKTGFDLIDFFIFCTKINFGLIGIVYFAQNRIRPYWHFYILYKNRIRPYWTCTFCTKQDSTLLTILSFMLRISIGLFGLVHFAQNRIRPYWHFYIFYKNKVRPHWTYILCTKQDSTLLDFYIFTKTKIDLIGLVSFAS